MLFPQSKADYFTVSAKLSLPARCPLLDRCERRAHTIAIANEWPLEQAVELAGLKEPIVESVGEGAYRIGGRNNFIVGGQCPEVNLFESLAALPEFTESPVIKGAYDKYWDPSHKILATGHYSQCAEYAKEVADIPTDLHVSRDSWLRINYQWIVGTLLALAGAIAGFLALR